MPLATEAFEQYASEHDAWFERNPVPYEAELRAIRAALPASGSGLEIGVGTGRFAGPLGIRAGIDPSPAMAAIARARGVEVTIGKAELLPFANEEFDYALMATTICFVDDLGAAFREAARVLKPGGSLVVGFIDRESPLGRQYTARRDRDPFYCDARFYSVPEVSSLIEKAGFEKPVASQTIFCSSDSTILKEQPIMPGHGEGSFVVLMARKQAVQRGHVSMNHHANQGQAVQQPRIYLDFNASTPLAPEVAHAMEQVLHEPFGNPSSEHWAGVPAHDAVEKARVEVSGLLACKPEEVVFTSGGSESNNHALKGVYFAQGKADAHIVTTQVEHPAIFGPCRFLERLGDRVTYLPVDGFGRVDPDEVRRAITPHTVLVSIMHANNEVGTIQPIFDISRITRERGILFHTDAAQSIGKISAPVEALGVDLLSIAGHKCYGPKGVGSLYIRRSVRLEPLIHGAGHESGRRAGTENVLLAVGLGAACSLAESWVGMESVRQLRDLFWNQLQERFGAVVVLNGHPDERLPNTLNVSFVNKVGSEILARTEGVAASTGSACHSGSVELSPVLKAMNVPPEFGMGAIRFSLGRTTTREEIEAVVSLLFRAVSALS